MDHVNKSITRCYKKEQSRYLCPSVSVLAFGSGDSSFKSPEVKSIVFL